MELHIKSTLHGKEDLENEVKSLGLTIATPADLADRAIDPTVLVALVGAGGTALGAIITGVIQLVKIKLQGNAGVIIVQAADGRRVEIPANIPAEKLDVLIDKINNLGPQKKVDIYLG